MPLPFPVILAGLKDKVLIIKRKLRYRPSKSQMPRKKDVAEVPDSEGEIPQRFSNLVIAVSGAIPGKTHACIEEMIKDLGAQFEKLDMNNCTHLVTTKGHVEYSRTQKVRDAISNENCEIVSIDWLLRTAEEKKIVDAKKHRLWEPIPPKKSEVRVDLNIKRTSKRKRVRVDTEDENDSARESKRFDLREFPFLSSLVDEAFAEDKKDLAVYKDADGVIWDATLLKPYENKTAHGVHVMRIQLLCNFKSRKFAIWLYKQEKNGKDTKPARVQWGILRTALVGFEESFMEASGLEWKDRHKQPQADKFLPVTCFSRNERASTVGADVQILPSKSICDALFDMIIRVQDKNQIASTIKTLATYVRAMVVNERNMRLGFSVLAKMSEVLSTGDQTQSHLSLLGKCYRGVFSFVIHNQSQFMGAQFPISDGNFEWVPRERQHLTFFKNLTTIQDMVKAVKPPIKQQQSAQELYRMLGLKSVDIVDGNSAEFSALQKYFNGSFGTPHTQAKITQVLRIERSGEADRFEQFQKENKSSIGTRRLLWHGAPSHNFIGLLAQGFRTSVLNCHAPEDVHPGIYLADFAGKSVGYCRAGHGAMALMLLCEVELGGKSWENHSSGYFNGYRTSLEGSGCISVLAQGRNQFNLWTDAKCIHQDLTGVLLPDVDGGRKKNGAGSLHHNEYIVFNPAQIRQRYLLQIKIG